MTSSFLICYPDVTVSALSVSSSQTYDTDYPIESSFYGHRHNYAQLTSPSTSIAITFDLGTGNSRTIDHLIVGGSQVLVANLIDQVVVAGSSDGSSWTNQLGTTTGFGSKTFNGPDADDIIFTQAYNDSIAGTLAAYRYFRVTISKTSSSSLYPLSKLYFGASFDMGLEPSTYNLEVLTDRDSDTWKFDRGQTLFAKAFHPRHRFTVEWDGVSDAKATALKETLLSNPYRQYVWLYASNYADPLYDNKLVYCKVIDNECTCEKEDQDWNLVKMVFEESI